MSSLLMNVTQFLWGTRNDTPKIVCAKHSVASFPREQCGKGDYRGPPVEMSEGSYESNKP